MAPSLTTPRLVLPPAAAPQVPAAAPRACRPPGVAECTVDPVGGAGGRRCRPGRGHRCGAAVGAGDGGCAGGGGRLHRAEHEAGVRLGLGQVHRLDDAAGFCPLPGPPLVVAHDVTAAAAEQTGVGKWRYTPATVSRWVSSINQVHTAAGLDAPGRAEVVRRALSGIRRIRATPPNRRSPLLLADIRARGCWPGPCKQPHRSPTTHRTSADPPDPRRRRPGRRRCCRRSTNGATSPSRCGRCPRIRCPAASGTS